MNPAQKNRLCSDPLQSCLTSLTEARIVRIFFPQPLPMQEHIDIFPFDHNALDGEVQRDDTKCLEIALGFFPQPVKLVDLHHERGQIRRIFLLIRLAKRFHRPIDTEIPFVIFGILNRLATAASPDQGYQAEQEQDGERWEFVRDHDGCSIGMGIGQVKRPVTRPSPYRRTPAQPLGPGPTMINLIR